MQEKTNEYYNDYSNFYSEERSSKYYEIINEFEADIVRSYSSRKSYAVEVGPGTGVIMNKLVKDFGKLVGVEPSDGMRERALAQGLDVVSGTAEDLPFADGEVDLVYTFMAYPHFADSAAFRKESSRCLKENGILIVGFYNRFSFKHLTYKIRWFRKSDPVHVRAQSWAEVRREFRDWKIEREAGTRIFGFHRKVYEIPALGSIFVKMDELCSKSLRHFAGYSFVVLRK